MELSNDQKAILRLLAQRGAAGYDDLSALLGVDTTEVHERAKAAAAQLEADGIPAPSIPTPGTAAPEAPAAPVAPTPTPPPTPPKPAAPAEPKAVAPSAPAPAPKPKTSRPPKLSLPKSGGARAALAAGAVVVVALIVILAVSGGGNSGGTTSAGAGETSGGSEETVSASDNPNLTQAVLDSVDGSDAKGVATFGKVKNSLALQVEAEGLEPTKNGDSYTIWLYASPRKMLPLASTAVPESGKIAAQVQVPTEVLAYLANETFDQLDISLTEDATLKASLSQGDEGKEGADLHRRRRPPRHHHRPDRRRGKESRKVGLRRPGEACWGS